MFKYGSFNVAFVLCLLCSRSYCLSSIRTDIDNSNISSDDGDTKQFGTNRMLEDVDQAALKNPRRRTKAKDEQQVAETYVEMSAIEMRFALSSIFEEFPSSLRSELLQLTKGHLSDFYSTLIRKNGNASSFNRFFLAVSIQNGESSGNRRLGGSGVNNNNNNNRDLQTSSVSYMNAAFNGYAVFRGKPTGTETNMIKNLSTLAFMGESHERFLRQVQSSANKVLSSVAQVSIVPSSVRRPQYGGNLLDDLTRSKTSEQDPSVDYVHVPDVKMNMALLFVLFCFTAGVFAGGFFFYRYNLKPPVRPDDETEETSKESFPNSFQPRDGERRGSHARHARRCSAPSSARASASKLLCSSSKHVRPTESISIKPGKNTNAYDGDNDDDTDKQKKQSKTRSFTRRKKKMSKAYKNRNRSDRLESVDVMSAIGEESDGELYIDFVDDMIKGEVRQVGSLFPSLQDRLSNKRKSYVSSFASSDTNENFNESYTPKKCTIPHLEFIPHCNKNSYRNCDTISLPPPPPPPPSSPRENQSSELIFYAEKNVFATPEKNHNTEQGALFSPAMFGNSPMSVIEEVSVPNSPKLCTGMKKMRDSFCNEANLMGKDPQCAPEINSLRNNDVNGTSSSIPPSTQLVLYDQNNTDENPKIGFDGIEG